MARLALLVLFLASGATALSAQPLEAQPPEAPGPGTGAVQVRSETTYYDVQGQTAEMLGRALAAHGPRIGGQGFFGLTEWEVSAEYRWAGRAAGCSVKDLTVHVAVQTRLPRWRAPADTPPDVRGAWERFVAALDLHERGHRRLAEEAADAIRDRLVALREPGCGRIQAAVQRTLAAVMSEYDAHNQAYDAETGHGRTQQAVWPQPALIAEAH